MADEKRKRGRPPNPHEPAKLYLTIPIGTYEYLEEAASTHLCGGETVQDVVYHLIYEGINRLVAEGKIGPDRRFKRYPPSSDGEDSSSSNEN